MKKILLVIQTPPPYGGGEIQAENLKKYFGNKKDFLIYDYSRKYASKKSQEKYNLISTFFGIYWICKIYYLIIRYKPQKIYFTLPKSFFGFLRNSFVVLFASIIGIKILGELAGSDFTFIDGSGSFKDKYGKNILNKTYQIRFLSKTINDNFKKMGITNGIIINNGVEIPIPEYYRVCTDYTLHILFIGSITKEKGFFDCLKALNECKKVNIKFKFFIIGDYVSTEEKKLFIDYIKKNNLENNLHFCGIKTNKEKWDIISKCQVFLLPSYLEGVPLTILEAMSLGLTIITTPVGGIKDTVTEGENGFIVNTGDFLKIKEIIIELFNNPEILGKFRNKNILKFKKEFELSIFIKNMENWFLNS